MRYNLNQLSAKLEKTNSTLMFKAVGSTSKAELRVKRVETEHASYQPCRESKF